MIGTHLHCVDCGARYPRNQSCPNGCTFRTMATKLIEDSRRAFRKALQEIVDLEWDCTTFSSAIYEAKKIAQKALEEHDIVSKRYEQKPVLHMTEGDLRSDSEAEKAPTSLDDGTLGAVV